MQTIKIITRAAALLTITVLGLVAVFPDIFELKDLWLADRQLQRETQQRQALRAARAEQRRRDYQQALSAAFFPDPQFRGCLLQQRPKLPAAIVNLDCSGRQISDLTGLERLSQLLRLNVANNRLSTLLVSNNPRLQEINAADNTLTALSLTAADLRSLDVRNNQLTALDLAAVPALTRLLLAGNPLSAEALASLSLPGDKVRLRRASAAAHTNAALIAAQPPRKLTLDSDVFSDPQFRRCVERRVRSKKLNAASAIRRLSCVGAKITSAAGVETLPELQVLDLNYNDIAALDLSQNPKLTRLSVSENEITILDLSNNPALKTLYAKHTGTLREVRFSKNHLLQTVVLNYGAIEQIRIAGGDTLKRLELSGNRLSRLDLGEQASLQTLSLSNNRLQTVDFSRYAQLTTLDLSLNQLNAIDVSGNFNLLQLGLAGNQLRELDLSNLAQLQALSVAGNPVNNLIKLSELALETLLLDAEQLQILRAVAPGYISTNPVRPLGDVFVIGKIGLWGL